MNAPHSVSQMETGEISPVPKRIIKRNLQEMAFDRQRLSDTLMTIRQRHNEYSRERQPRLEAQILRQLKHKQAGAPYPSVLQLQDAIEHSLWTNGFFKSAQYFISHRAERRILRQQRHRLQLLIQSMQQALKENPQNPAINSEGQNNENWQALCLSLFAQIFNQVVKADSESTELSEDLECSLKQLPNEILAELLDSVGEKIKN